MESYVIIYIKANQNRLILKLTTNSVQLISWQIVLLIITLFLNWEIWILFDIVLTEIKVYYTLGKYRMH